MALLLYKWLMLACWLPSAPHSGAAMPHPLYVTVTEIAHNQKDGILEISCKIFADDMEVAILKTAKVKIDVANPKDKTQADKAISNYVRAHLQVKPDGKATSLEFIGYECENDAVWSYFQVSNVKTPPKKIDITNSILYDVYEKEINLVHVEVGGERKSTKLDNPKKNATIVF